MKKLSLAFYKRKDVVAIAKDLIGKIIVTNVSVNASNAAMYKVEWDKDGDGVYEAKNGLDWNFEFKNTNATPKM